MRYAHVICGSTNAWNTRTPELARILAVRRRAPASARTSCRRECAVPPCRPRPSCAAVSVILLQLRCFGLQRELRRPSGRRACTVTCCGSLNTLARVVEVEIEQRVLLRVLERERRVLLRPLPLDRGVVLGDFGRVPAVLEHHEQVLGLRQQLQLRHLVGALPDVLARQRQPLLVVVEYRPS